MNIRSVYFFIILYLSFASLGCNSNEDKAPTLGLDKPFVSPEWTGEYEVGIREFWLHDESRDETFTDDPNDHRSVLMTICYPAKHEPGLQKLKVYNDFFWHDPRKFYINGDRELRKSNYDNATWDISIGAEVSDAAVSFPILINSHGHASYRSDVEGASADGFALDFITNPTPEWVPDVVSHGFIIVSIFHPYGIAAVLEDGHMESAVTLPEEDFGAHIPIWIADQRFVIDTVESMNADDTSFLFNKVDMTKLGVFGHSYGGATSFHTAYQDERVVAAIDIDGTIPYLDDKVLDKPFAFYTIAARPPLALLGNEVSTFDQFQNDFYRVNFVGFNHGTFTGGGLPWQWDFPEQVPGDGSVDLDASRVNTLMATSVRQFFEKYLLNKNAEWLDVPSETPPEMNVEIFHPAS